MIHSPGMLLPLVPLVWLDGVANVLAGNSQSVFRRSLQTAYPLQARLQTPTLTFSRRRMPINQDQPQWHRKEQQTSLYCSVFQDACPTTFDGVCDRDTNSQCEGGDCFDCDECQVFRSDCEGCLANGCAWCPGDATCFNSNQYVMLNRATSCNLDSDYSKTCTADINLFNDPLYSAQSWVYQMIHVEEVWNKGYKGNGVRVRINDNGVMVSHPEFEGRIDLNASCALYKPMSAEGATDASHGTYVAAIVGAAADNGICSVGIAPQVTISSCNVFSDDDESNAFLNEDQMSTYDIAQNSFGEIACAPRIERRTKQRKLQSCPFVYQVARQVSTTPYPCDVCGSSDFSSDSQDCKMSIVLHCKVYFREDQEGCLEFLDLLVKDGGCYYSTLPVAVADGLNRGIRLGRNGKGIIFVAASGNSYASGGDTNLGGYLSSHLVISVGSVGKSGLHASYSVPGASLFITAPGGDVESISSHVTAAYTTSGALCQNAGIGTSFACPVVSGVVALMLEANPDLTWKDVQEILAMTSQSVDDPDDDTIIINGAGYWHSNFYGFGIVDAGAAVAAAEVWENVGEELMLVEDSGKIDLPIVDNTNNITVSKITLSSDDDAFRIQSVQVLLDLEYYSRGHLKITLTSPNGTLSILHPGRRPENSQLDLDSGERWKFLTVRSWGESPQGIWTLKIVDLKEGEVSTDCVDAAWTIDRSHIGNGELDPVDCHLLQSIGACVGGVINPSGLVTEQDLDILLNQYTDEYGKTARSACCACGGEGVSRQDVKNQLHQWTLVVYGYSANQAGGGSESDGGGSSEIEGGGGGGDEGNEQRPNPSSSPTDYPSERPSDNPSLSPSVVPTGKVFPHDDAQPTVDTVFPTVDADLLNPPDSETFGQDDTHGAVSKGNGTNARPWTVITFSSSLILALVVVS